MPDPNNGRPAAPGSEGNIAVAGSGEPLNPAISRLLEFSADMEFRDLPDAVIEHVKRCFLDCLGVALAGTVEPPASKARILANPLGGPSTVWGTTQRASVVEAALINGCAAHALDYDDSYVGAVPIHISATLVPALLAMGEARGASGRALMLALAVGGEVGIRLAEAIGRTHLLRGWHTTGTVGTLGVAVGVGKLLGFSATQLAASLGLGAVQAAGLVQATGTMCKPLNAGKAAANGLIAVQLAEASFTSPINILDMPHGFGALFSGGYDAERAIQGLGEQYLMLQVGFKPHACCRQTHATIDAVLEARRANDLRPDEIAQIRVEVHPTAADVVGILAPQDGTEAKFSLTYCASLGVLSDDAHPSRFTDVMVRDPRIRAIWPKVKIVPNTDFEPLCGQSRVTLTTTDGRQYTGFSRRARGRGDNPLSREEIERKFLALAEPMIGVERSARLVDLITHLEEADAASLAAVLSGAAGTRRDEPMT